MANLSQKIGSMDFDGLLTDITPKTEVRGKTIRRVTEETVYKRGTLLGLSSSDNMLVALADAASGSESLTADCILCDDTSVGADEDVTAAVYTAGCFDPDKVETVSGYTITAEDYDNLRKYGIVFKAASEEN